MLVFFNYWIEKYTVKHWKSYGYSSGTTEREIFGSKKETCCFYYEARNRRNCDVIWFCFGKEKSQVGIKFVGTRQALGREMVFKEDGCRLGRPKRKNKTKGWRQRKHARFLMDFLVLYIKGNPLIPTCCYVILTQKNNFVCVAFMNGDRNAVTQLYRVIQEESSIFC